MTNPYPNKRGTAVRDSDKRFRISTHVEVLKASIDFFNIENVIEHGMGYGSTPFFHTQERLKKLISFENVPRWQVCSSCPGTFVHTIHTFREFSDAVLPLVEESDKTLGFADGDGQERVVVVKHCMEMGCPAIVEHDAETYTTDDLNERIHLATKHGYTFFQFVKYDPEVSLFVKQVPDFVNEVDYFKIC